VSGEEIQDLVGRHVSQCAEEAVDLGVRPAVGTVNLGVDAELEQPFTESLADPPLEDVRNSTAFETER